MGGDDGSALTSKEKSRSAVESAAVCDVSAAINASYAGAAIRPALRGLPYEWLTTGRRLA